MNGVDGCERQCFDCPAGEWLAGKIATTQARMEHAWTMLGVYVLLEQYADCPPRLTHELERAVRDNQERGLDISWLTVDPAQVGYHINEPAMLEIEQQAHRDVIDSEERRLHKLKTRLAALENSCDSRQPRLLNIGPFTVRACQSQTAPKLRRYGL